MHIVDIAKKRYSTKEFDPEKPISEENIAAVKALLQQSASSTNLQPWHFVLTGSKEGIERVAKSTEGPFAFNTPRILDASYVVVFCARTHVDEAYLRHVLAQEEADGRLSDPEMKEMMHGARSMFVNIHQYELKDLQHWMEKQVYLNMGNFLLGVAALGLDALPMEGVDLAMLDEEFGLRKKGYTAVGVVSLGYHKESDYNAHLPKSRLPEDEIFTIV